MARTCPCPNPPGGSVTCSDDQLAMCGYRDGQIVSGCFDPPHGEASSPQVLNWALEMITGEKRGPNQLISVFHQNVLRTGRYQVDGVLIMFSLPRERNRSNRGGATASAD
jgi:hypothetical protein